MIWTVSTFSVAICLISASFEARFLTFQPNLSFQATWMTCFEPYAWNWASPSSLMPSRTSLGKPRLPKVAC